MSQFIRKTPFWNNIKNFHYKSHLSLFLVLALILVTGVTVYEARHTQDLRSHAAISSAITFVNVTGNVITQTTSPTVNVILTSPWSVQGAVAMRHNQRKVARAKGNVAGTSTYVVYDDGLRNGWTDGSYHAAVNFHATNPIYSGTNSIGVKINQGYGALEFNAPSRFSTTGYANVQFFVHATQPNTDLALYTDNTRFQFLGNPVRLFNYGGYPSTTGWTQYTVPLTDLSAVNKNIGDITIQNNTRGSLPLFYVDQVQLTSASGVPVPSSFVPSPTNVQSTPTAVQPTSAPTVALTPTPAPYTTSVELAEDANFSTNVKTILPYSSNPLSTVYMFSNSVPGTKTLYAKFIASDGSTQTYSNSIQLVSAVTPTPAPTIPVTTPSSVPTPQPSVGIPTPTPTTPPSSGRVYPWHTGIVSTTFWVGEIFNASLSDGSQVCSTYDVNWAYHWSGINGGTVPSSASDCPGSIVGGCDGVGGAANCQTEKRTAANNYFPSSVKALENPFYLDLPFDDINDSTAYNERCQVIPWANDSGYTGQCTNQNFSYMKNRWVKIVGPNGNTCYGQVEDAGPSHGSLYHDANYVFGTTNAQPVQGQFNNAGLDVSPALNGCLGYAELDGENDKVNWQFVDDANVPAGPWTIVVTHSGVSE